MSGPDGDEPPASQLSARIADRTATVAVIGMGAVGLTLAKALADAGYATVGIDTDPRRLRDIAESAGEPVGLEMSSDMGAIQRADALLICVPTPLTSRGEPDLSSIREAASDIASHGRADQLVVLESTTFPGTTRNVLLPALGRSPDRSRAPSSLHSPLVAYSPERLDPGRTDDYRSLPKLVAGIDATSAELARILYDNVFKEVVLVSDVETAEAAKLLENTFRAVNIALVNELKYAFEAMDVDIWDAIEAAASKPFGFMPFYPGPGIGGHCIAVDPSYLTWACRRAGAPVPLVETAISVNRLVPHLVIERVARALEQRRRSLAGAKILVVGVAYKADIGDVRQSPGILILRELQRRGARASYHDPHVPRIELADNTYASVEWVAETLTEFDAAIIVTDHTTIDFELLTAADAVIVDTRNALKRRGLGGTADVIKA